MTWATNLDIASVVVQTLVIGLVIYRRIYKTLPLFSCYLLWLLLIQGASAYFASHPSSGPVFERVYFGASIVDTTLVVCVLIELSMSVLRPIRSSLPRWTFFVMSGLLIGLFLAIWPFAKPPGLSGLLPINQHIVHLDITASVLRILFFLGLAGCSQLLSLGWRDRELQIATGLGFYSLVSLSVTLLHMNQGAGTEEAKRIYYILDEVVAGSYVVSMLYWVVSFAQKVPERREFTPQMQSFLLALAGNARTTRLAMTSSPELKKAKSD